MIFTAAVTQTINMETEKWLHPCLARWTRLKERQSTDKGSEILLAPLEVGGEGDNNFGAISREAVVKRHQFILADILVVKCCSLGTNVRIREVSRVVRIFNLYEHKGMCSMCLSFTDNMCTMLN